MILKIKGRTCILFFFESGSLKNVKIDNHVGGNMILYRKNPKHCENQKKICGISYLILEKS